MVKRPFEVLTGRQIHLRPLVREDLEMTLGWRNKERIRSRLKTSRTISLPEHLAWFHYYEDSDDDFMYVICERETLRPLGQVSLYNIRWEEGTAELGRLMIGEEEALRRGYSTQAVRALVEHAFTLLGLQHLRLEVFPSNYPAVILYHRCGFRLDEYRNGMMLMSIRRPDPSANPERDVEPEQEEGEEEGYP